MIAKIHHDWQSGKANLELLQPQALGWSSEPEVVSEADSVRESTAGKSIWRARSGLRSGSVVMALCCADARRYSDFSETGARCCTLRIRKNMRLQFASPLVIVADHI